MRNACIVCGGSYGPGGLPGLVVCGTCGFVTADIALKPEELRSLYSANYFSGGEYRDYLAERHLHEKHFRRRLRLLEKYLPNPAESTLFEVGCAHGFFLHLAKGMFREVGGIDISEDAVRYATENLGIPAVAGDLLDQKSIGNPDVVCLWDTIEHLERPDAYLRKLSAEMSPGSLIAVTTGDIGSLVARTRGARWRMIHPPTHLHYFSRDTLARLLQNCGFEVCHSSHEGTYRSLDTAAYIIFNIKRQWPGAYTALRKTGILGISFYLNLFDIMLVLARKAPSDKLKPVVK